MDNLTSAPRTTVADRAGDPWRPFEADAYLDHRHRNWALAEELGHVRFDPAAGVVLVHGHRAEHIVTVLGAGEEIAPPQERLAPPATMPLAPAAPGASAHPVPSATVRTPRASRSRTVLGWLGLVAGAAVFVAALAVPLDDPALIAALMIGVRAGRLILGIE
jgi:hypothetical protein